MTATAWKWDAKKGRPIVRARVRQILRASGKSCVLAKNHSGGGKQDERATNDDAHKTSAMQQLCLVIMKQVNRLRPESLDPTCGFWHGIQPQQTKDGNGATVRRAVGQTCRR